MSERGRGSGPYGNDADDDETASESPAGSRPLSGAGSRPIAPYDPYRPPSVDAPRLPRDAYEPPPRRPSRAADDDPFLPEDDPLSSGAWQLEPDDAAIDRERGEDLLPERDREVAPPPTRNPRRQPDATRGGRESTTGATSSDRKRRAAASAGERGRPSRSGMTLAVPRAVAGAPLFADQVAVVLLGVNAASFVLMALVLGVRLGGIAAPTVLHLDAAGNPDRWGPPSVLWRLPVSSFFITLMALVIAWFMHPIDRFAARFALGAAVVAQVIAWVAVIQHIA